MKIQTFLLLIVVFIVMAGGVLGQGIPQCIYYQGNLADAAGNPIDDPQPMDFKIYDSESGGTMLWDESHAEVPVNEGLFAVMLGSENAIPLSVFSGLTRYLEIIIDGETLNPRQQIASVPFAFTTASVQGESNVFPSEGYVGVGTTTPATNIHAHGPPVNNRGQLSLSAPENYDAFLTFYEGASYKSYLWYDVSMNALRLQNVNRGDGGDLSLNPYGGNVGIGTISPSELLEVNGRIYSTTDGFKFPDGTIQTTAATGGGGGDITAVNAGTGLSGGGTDGDVTLSLDETYTNGKYVNEGQMNSIIQGMISNNAIGGAEVMNSSLTADDLAVDVVSSIDGVSSDGGNVDLVEGNNITITPNAGAGSITISSTAGGGLTLPYTGSTSTRQSAFQVTNTGIKDPTFKTRAGVFKALSGHTGIFGEGGDEGVRGEGSVYGVYGKHATGGYGYLGSSEYGVYGEGGSLAGVFGKAYTFNGAGVEGVDRESNNKGYLGGLGYGVKSEGDLVVNNGEFRGDIGPNNGAPFPKPAYDSGWWSVSQGTFINLRHNLGGNVDDYIVDLQFKDLLGSFNRGINNMNYGGDDQYGAYWSNLNTETIHVHRRENDAWANQVRVRIWKLK